MANTEVSVLTESLVKWQSNKAAATVMTLGFIRSASVAVTKAIEDITDTTGTYAHAKKTQDPDVAVAFTMSYRDRTNSFLGEALAQGFEEKAAATSTDAGKLIIDTLLPDGTYDSTTIPNVTLMSYTRRSTGDIAFNFAAVGEPAFGVAATSATAVAATNNAETMVQAETYVKWKTTSTLASTPAPAVQTLGFAEGWDLAVTYNKRAIRNNDGTFSHWKTLKKPSFVVNVNKLHQDSVTELLGPNSTGLTPASAKIVSGFNQLKSGQSVPTGTLSVEGRHADGTTLDVVQFANAKLKSWTRNLAEPDTLALSFSGIGYPTYSATTLS